MLLAMRRIAISILLLVLLAPPAWEQSSPATSSFLGFDRNDYPGDTALPLLRKTFSYTGYWLNVPPGAHANSKSWKGKRKTVEDAGFGFLVLSNGRLYAEIKKAPDPSILGRKDAAAAVAAAKEEGFPAGTILFLDQEQGGRMLPEQRAYIQAWIDGVGTTRFHAGVYCSGIPRQRRRRTNGDRRRHFWSERQSGCHLLGDQRCLPAIARMCFRKTAFADR